MVAGFCIHDVVFIAMTKIPGPLKVNIDQLLNFDRSDEEINPYNER